MVQLWLVLVLTAVVSVNAGGENCPLPTFFPKDFRLDMFVGNWYDAKVNQNWFAPKCGSYNFDFGSENIVYTRSYKPWYWFQRTYTGTIDISLKNEVSFSFTHKFWGVSYHDGPYHILGTDYNNYAILWKCKERLWREPARSIYVLVRDKNYRVPTKEIEDTLKKLGDSVSELYDEKC